MEKSYACPVCGFKCFLCFLLMGKILKRHGVSIFNLWKKSGMFFFDF